jgi:hypothetical protein
MSKTNICQNIVYNHKSEDPSKFARRFIGIERFPYNVKEKIMKFYAYEYEKGMFEKEKCCNECKENEFEICDLCGKKICLSCANYSKENTFDKEALKIENEFKAEIMEFKKRFETLNEENEDHYGKNEKMSKFIYERSLYEKNYEKKINDLNELFNNDLNYKKLYKTLCFECIYVKPIENFMLKSKNKF